MPKRNADSVMGATIVAVRSMTRAEADREGWNIGGFHGAPFVLVLSTGALLYPSRDDEGNGPGAIFGTYKGQAISFTELLDKGPDDYTGERSPGSCANALELAAESADPWHSAAGKEPR